MVESTDNTLEPTSMPQVVTSYTDENNFPLSHSHSIVSTIEEELTNALKETTTRQEELVTSEITPFQLEFWKPHNIMSVEDTPFSKRYLVTLIVIAFSIPGNLARDSMILLTKYDNSYINFSGGTVVWINFSASFVMSWCNNSVKFWSIILENSGKTNMKQLALHTAITSGFCGSFSTFSSSLIEIFFKTIDIVKNPLPNDGYRVMEFFASSLTAFALPIFGHILGKHFALFFDTYLVPYMAGFLTYKNVRVFEIFCVIIGSAALIANLVLTCTLNVTYFYKETYSFAILMGVFGALLRFKLSSFNGRFVYPWYPTGTFFANIIGCFIISILYLLMLGLQTKDSLIIENNVHQFIIKGFSSGFCGSLTTMSSFINELYNLDYPLYQHIYFWSTFIPCFIFIILIDGSYAWARGFKHV
ncbi:hypothetical protein C6P40_004121 [Pichia californica]|uniref:Uncharacterized protein n=1 Tax=Pichia californica TaxID=460514 RepID=A0A9P7BC38_9ASCO|nr:hypothetical protein C6P42_003818 [[Candida] californica]KAG0686432.1 hypothetical protein C6P40_004121 [[Candida] californica]